MAKDLIHFVITGGTIDSCFYNKTQPRERESRNSVVPSYVRSLKLHDKVNFTIVGMKDSRQLTEKDLKSILKAIRKSRSGKIVMTHGTYTMTDTAGYLKRELGSRDKTIVLTGSMVPLAVKGSDAQFNLGYAVAKVNDLAPGIYICMNGRTFKPGQTMKHRGRFISIVGEK